MNIKYGYPEGMDLQIKLLMAVFVTLSLGNSYFYKESCCLMVTKFLVDYLLGIGNNYEQVAAAYGRNITAELVFASSFPQLFAYVPYSIFTTVFCTVRRVV